MVAAVGDLDLDVDHRVAGQDAALHGLDDALLDGLMNSLGMAPPTMSFSNSKPLPGSCGMSRSQPWPYWPLPPVCRTYLPSASTVWVMVSR